MSGIDIDTFELWADFLTAAATAENPVESIIAILVEFENHVYNRALNDVSASLRNQGFPAEEIITRMQAHAESVSSKAFPPNVIPFRFPGNR